MSNFAWTPEQVERLVALSDGTRSAAEIGAQFGVSRNAIVGKLARLRAADRIDAKVGLLMSGASGTRRGRKRRSAQSPAGEGKVYGFMVGAARRVVPVISRPKPPTFIKEAPVTGQIAKQVAAPVAEALPAAPMPFLDAVEKRRCLFFHGDPYGAAGPAMPVCGAPRLTTARVLPPYCRAHLALRYRPRDAA